MSIVERMIPNPTQDSHIPSFVPETTDGDKAHSLQVVPSQPPYEAVVGLAIFYTTWKWHEINGFRWHI